MFSQNTLLPEINTDYKKVHFIQAAELSKKIFKEVFNSKFNPGHGVICVYRGNDKKNYVLASPRINPESASVQIQVAMGGRISASKVVLESLQETIKFKTNFSQLSPRLQDDFYFSNYYFAFTHAEWNMCYLTFIAISKNEYSLDQLRKITSDINQNGDKKFQYGIYDVDQVCQLAEITNAQDEKEKSFINITNFLPEEPVVLPGVVFDDSATNALSSYLRNEAIQELLMREQNKNQNQFN